MEKIISLRIEKLPEGAYLATSRDLPGLVVQGGTIAETLDFARDVARQLIETRQEWTGDAGALSTNPIQTPLDVHLVVAV